MFGAVKRFGVMPKTPYPEETIKQIADYMFDFDIEQPEWFEDHFNEEKGKGQGMRNGKGKVSGMQKKTIIFALMPQLNEERLEVNPNYDDRGVNTGTSNCAA